MSNTSRVLPGRGIKLQWLNRLVMIKCTCARASFWAVSSTGSGGTFCNTCNIARLPECSCSTFIWGIVAALQGPARRRPFDD